MRDDQWDPGDPEYVHSEPGNHEDDYDKFYDKLLGAWVNDPPFAKPGQGEKYHG